MTDSNEYREPDLVMKGLEELSHCVVEMYEHGDSFMSIGRRVSQMLQKMRWTKPQKPAQICATRKQIGGYTRVKKVYDHQEVIRLRNSGMTYNQIATAVGGSHTAVFRICNGGKDKKG